MLDAIQEKIKPWAFARQEVWWVKIISVVQRIKDWIYKTKEVKLQLDVFNLDTYNFEVNNLSDFLVHCVLVNNSDLNYPVIINNNWVVIDWRHRICKAILMWLTSIDAIMILDDEVID